MSVYGKDILLIRRFMIRRKGRVRIGSGNFWIGFFFGILAGAETILCWIVISVRQYFKKEKEEGK